MDKYAISDPTLCMIYQSCKESNTTSNVRIGLAYKAAVQTDSKVVNVQMLSAERFPPVIHEVGSDQ